MPATRGNCRACSKSSRANRRWSAKEANGFRPGSKKTRKLVHKLVYHEAEIVGADGRVTRQISLDLSEKDQIPIIIQRERKRKPLPLFSDEELAKAAGNYEIRTIQNPVVKVEVPPVSFAHLPHAMFKIAYELAFL